MSFSLFLRSKITPCDPPCESFSPASRALGHRVIPSSLQL
ncbi:hypothetical protein HMPREF9374_3144 [Desmospora sp. 8437]|nr:hypothetical protein HMPREF9374_3144 [Desmospora sp. 8437]